MKTQTTNLEFVSYYRVSTEKQGVSGLGLEAQRQTVRAYVERVGGVLVQEFSETQSGKLENTKNRVEFAKALNTAKRSGAVLIVAKLDRLARCCSVLESVQAAGVRFRVAECPEANELTLGLLMVLAKNEREMCSARTRAALAVKKQQGAKLGAAREGARKFTAADAQAARERHAQKARNDKANRHAWAYAQQLRANGDGFAKVAEKLNAEGYTTPRGCAWNGSQVQRLEKMFTA